MSDTKNFEHDASSGTSVSPVNSTSILSMEFANLANNANKFGVTGALVSGDFVVGVSVGESVVGVRVRGLSVGAPVVGMRVGVSVFGFLVSGDSVGDIEGTGGEKGLTVG